jgi:hypothetical protein
MASKKKVSLGDYELTTTLGTGKDHSPSFITLKVLSGE